MSAKIEEMLSCCYEIEGLLHVAQRLSNDIPQVTLEKLRRKTQELAAMAQDLPQTAPAPVKEEPQPEPKPIPEDPMMEPEGLPSEDYDADETWQHDNGEEFKEVFTLDYEEPKHLAEPEPEPAKEPVAETARREPLRVDEKLQRTLSRDLRKAFSINDRYRFMRELFNGSSDKMNRALDRIQAMSDYNQAEQYFYQECGWDSENDVVTEFMLVVRNHFH